jgi:predicted AAA+ superfamily ATPase
MMELLPKGRLDEVLRMHNPWWTSASAPAAGGRTQPRAVDGLLAEGAGPALLSGPRRSGKTSALLRLVDGEMRRGRAPRRIAYLPFDHPLIRLAPPDQVVSRALEGLDRSGPALILLDGLQALPDWPRHLAALVDTHPGERLVAAVSARPEPGEVTFDVFHLPPLRFREFCQLRGLPDLGAPPLDLLDAKLPADSAAEDYFFNRVLDPMLADYLVRGGFPQAVLEPDQIRAREEIRESVVARALFQDLPGVAGVLKLGDLQRVLLAALVRGGAPIPIETFAESLDLDRQTLGRYLDHLERLLLILSLRNHAAATERSRPCVHPVDPGLPNALLERDAAVLARPAERRALLAGAVVSHVEDLARARGFDLAYFRGGEVAADLVVVTPDGPIPILIVDREDVAEEDAAAVERLLRRLQARTAFVLSRAQPRRRTSVSFFESVIHLPTAYFLYALQP